MKHHRKDTMDWREALSRLPAHHQAEVVDLVAAYGAPRYCHVYLDDGRFDPLRKTDRAGEVGMVIRRRDGNLIVARKTFYPPNVFRLLTGGIGPDESISAALAREVAEETSLTVRINRFLNIITYQSNVEIPYYFVSYVFLLDELAGTLQASDPNEQVDEFRTIPPAELVNLAQQLRQLSDTSDPAIRGKWASWGRFRAVMHEECAAWMNNGMLG